MVQDVLAQAEWAGVLGEADRRGLTPLFHSNMTPYGEIQLNLDRRISFDQPQHDEEGTSGFVGEKRPHL